MFGGGGGGEGVVGEGAPSHLPGSFFTHFKGNSHGPMATYTVHLHPDVCTNTCTSTLSGSPFIFKDLCCHFYVATMLLALVGRSREIKKSVMIKRVILASASLHAIVSLGIVLIYLELRLYPYLDA